MNKQEFNIVSGLADLLETYTDKVSKLKNNKTMPFSTMDMAGWKLYFQQLILTDVLEDGRGWGSETNDTNVGVGKDGEFSAGELYQLLMQCYKYLYLALTVTEIHLTEEGWHLDGNEEFQDVCKLMHLLEKYHGVFLKNANATVTLQGADMSEWMGYFRRLLLTDILVDGKAFGEPTNDTHLGIGSDGCCVAAEYYQLLMQCYKYLYLALASGSTSLRYYR